MNTDVCITTPPKTQSDLILQPRHSRILFGTSWILLFTAAYAINQKHYDLAICPIGIFATSVNYWRHPIRGWRRNIDILIVLVASFYQIVRASTAEHAQIFYTSYAIAFSFYPISNYYYVKGHKTESVICHALLHILGNISSIILYSGSIKSIINLYLNDTPHVN
jgi:hypothetical protein